MKTTYENIKTGMVFIEVEKRRGRRTVEVIAVSSLYTVMVRVIDGRGRGHEVQMWRKQLVDESKWRYSSEEP